MPRRTLLALSFLFLLLIHPKALEAYAFAQNPFSVLLVDKYKHQIHLAQYTGSQIAIQKSFHVTLGKAEGDKEIENDLKTPEGVYFFTSKQTQPQLKKKFGIMALHMNYPNPIDRIAGKTGYAIMLHSTDDPDRLKRDRDSEGCVVIDNPEIEEISHSVRLGLTPIIIYPELKSEYLQPNSDSKLKETFDHWLTAWNSKDLDAYIGSYIRDFKYSGMNLKQYRNHKQSLNQKYAEIKVAADNLRFFHHPKYQVVSFTQRYYSRLKNGSTGFKSSGTKILYFIKQGDGYKIADESYSSVVED